MKLTKILFAVFILLINYQFLLSQEKNENLVLFDSVSEMNYEDLAVRMDRLASEIYDQPRYAGYLVMYSGSDPIKNAFNRNTIIRYIKFRGFDDKRLSLITASESNKPRFEFWISKDGRKPKINEENFRLALPSDKAVNFIDGLIEIINIEGKQTFFDVGCDAGCIETLDFSLLSDFLDANPQLKAYVIVHARSLKKARQVKGILAREAFEDAKISSNQLNFLFGGKNKVNENDFSEVEVYLASDDSQLPKSSSIKYRPL